jgi:hypothetical protein
MKNGFVCRTRPRNRLAGFVVTEWLIDDEADEYGDEPAGEETSNIFTI